MGKIIRLDLDNYRMSKEDILEMYSSLPKPFYIRKSAFKHGYHVKFNCPFYDCQNDCYSCYFYLLFDDRKRLELNIIRKSKKLSHNVLWDRKDNNSAQKWVEINTLSSLKQFFK